MTSRSDLPVPDLLTARHIQNLEDTIHAVVLWAHDLLGRDIDNLTEEQKNIQLGVMLNGIRSLVESDKP